MPRFDHSLADAMPQCHGLLPASAGARRSRPTEFAA